MILPDQTIYELQALKIAMSWDYPASTPEELDHIIDRLKYSISEVVITLLLNSLSNEHTWNNASTSRMG